MVIQQAPDGGGGETLVRTTRFFVVLDDTQLFPVVTQVVEIENDSETDTVQDQCGRTERSKEGSKGWTVSVEGYVTANDEREQNLSLQKLRDNVARRDKIKIISDIISGTFVVSNIVITQDNEVTAVETDETDGEEPAYRFQLQLGEEENDN